MHCTLHSQFLTKVVNLCDSIQVWIYWTANFLNEQGRHKPLAGSGGGLPQEMFWDFYSLSPLSWVSK